MDHAEIYYSAVFAPGTPDEHSSTLNKNNDLISGGSNGFLYQWTGNECQRVLKVSNSPIRALQVHKVTAFLYILA